MFTNDLPIAKCLQGKEKSYIQVSLFSKISLAF